MESARSGEWFLHQATRTDAPRIAHLLKEAALSHAHLDWHLPVDWIGSPGFVLCEAVAAAGAESQLLGCLAVGADPPPAAWVRVAALRSGGDGEQRLSEMIRATLPWLREKGVSLLGWLPTELWPERWLAAAGLHIVNHIVTYALDRADFETRNSGPATIRPAAATDMPLLAEIEEAAFDPLWRYSAQGLLLAQGRALSFEVAELGGRIVGFQYSVTGQDRQSAHLVRLTVSPGAQGRGVGSGLMASALEGYTRLGVKRVTLNTQLDNHSSQRLYERFGFRLLGDRAPVWAVDLG
ncbi:MAG: GNAT family N-acetyltransferase [Chloroflexota bacterium]|nr:MAG: GNAT family N-acetyltransferase [Chloroflexota bacterium]